MIEYYEYKNNKIIKFRYILIIILVILIMLLISFIVAVTFAHNQKREVEKHENENIMIIELEDKIKKKEEEERQRILQQEKEEEQNATGVIYLTFDDGPSSDSTPQILDILKRNNIKATFFVLHYSEENSELIKREQNEGHTIALHGYTHTYSDIYYSADACIENFRKIQNQVYETTGIKSNIIRFPGGSSNTVSRRYSQGVMTELTKRVIDEGFRYFDWNADSTDAARPKSSDTVYENTISALEPGRNNVVLMHDFHGNHKTIDALQDVINYGLENGYVFRKITEETPMVTHSVNN